MWTHSPAPNSAAVTTGQTNLQAQLGALGGLGMLPLGCNQYRPRYWVNIDHRDDPESKKSRLQNNMDTEIHFTFLQVCK